MIEAEKMMGMRRGDQALLQVKEDLHTLPATTSSSSAWCRSGRWDKAADRGGAERL